jgi:hypothetical protein
MADDLLAAKALFVSCCALLVSIVVILVTRIAVPRMGSGGTIGSGATARGPREEHFSSGHHSQPRRRHRSRHYNPARRRLPNPYLATRWADDGDFARHLVRRSVYTRINDAFQSAVGRTPHAEATNAVVDAYRMGEVRLEDLHRYVRKNAGKLQEPKKRGARKPARGSRRAGNGSDATAATAARADGVLHDYLGSMHDMLRRSAKGLRGEEGFVADAQQALRAGDMSMRDVLEALVAEGGGSMEHAVEEFFDGVAIPRGESADDMPVMHFPFPHAPPRLPPRFSDAEASARDRVVSIYTSIFGDQPSDGTVGVLTRRRSEFEGDDKRLFNLVSTLYTVSKMQSATDDARLQAAISATLRDLEAAGPDRPAADGADPLGKARSAAAAAAAAVKPMDEAALAAAVTDNLRASDSDVAANNITQAIRDWRAVSADDYAVMRRPNAARGLQSMVDARQFAASDVFNMHIPGGGGGAAAAAQPPTGSGPFPSGA